VTPEELANQIRGLPFAAALSPEVFAGFAETLDTVGLANDLEPGAVLFTEGDKPTDQGIVILSGTVLIQKPGAPEAEQSSPELLGEMTRFNPTGHRTATVTVKQPCSILTFTWSNFEKVARRRMNEGDFNSLMKTLEEYAWQHFTM
jgi:CRP-like cAMP-binding protein